MRVQAILCWRGVKTHWREGHENFRRGRHVFIFKKSLIFQLKCIILQFPNIFFFQQFFIKNPVGWKSKIQRSGQKAHLEGVGKKIEAGRCLHLLAHLCRSPCLLIKVFYLKSKKSFS